jgi:hypothetical protein
VDADVRLVGAYGGRFDPAPGGQPLVEVLGDGHGDGGGQPGAHAPGHGLPVRQWGAGFDGGEQVGDLHRQGGVAAGEVEQSLGPAAVVGGGVAAVEAIAA